MAYRLTSYVELELRTSDKIELLKSYKGDSEEVNQ